MRERGVSAVGWWCVVVVRGLCLMLSGIICVLCSSTPDTNWPSAYGLSQDVGELGETLDAMEHTGSATDNTIRRSTQVEQNRRRAAENEETETNAFRF